MSQPETLETAQDTAQDTTYNGWRNRETWNVALWLSNDFPTYNAVRAYRTYPQPFQSFRDDLRKGMLKCTTTGAGVRLWDRSLDIEALNEMIQEE